MPASGITGRGAGGGEGGGDKCPETFDRENFGDLSGKTRQGKRNKIEKCRRKCGKWKREGGK